MRFRSDQVEGIRVSAVTGINTVSFGIEANAAAREGLLGFAIERIDPVEQERYYMPGFKVFPIRHPTPGCRHVRLDLRTPDPEPGLG